MIEVGPLGASAADWLRLLVVPAFLWAALQDHRTRRVPDRVWRWVAAIAGSWFVIALVTSTTDTGTIITLTAVSLGVLVPLAYGFWYIGGFGGADAKAIIVLAAVFGPYPTYEVASWTLPIETPAVGVFSIAVLTNAVILGLGYPLSLGVRNALRGRIRALMFVGRPAPVETLTDKPGRLLESPDGVDRTGLDLDALRMYLRWRDCTLAELRTEPDRYRREPPASTADPGDGVITDGGEPADPWAAEDFLEAVEGSAYGTDPATLRGGLELLTSRERVWYSPGIPFIVLITAGLLLALGYGDVLLVGLSTLGLV